MFARAEPSPNPSAAPPQHLVSNPTFGPGDRRTLVLTVALSSGVVLTVILGCALISDWRTGRHTVIVEWDVASPVERWHG